jgi:hypothetical protein
MIQSLLDAMEISRMKHRVFAWAIVLSLFLVGLVLLPLILDRPFATQTPRTLTLIYHLRAWMPALAAAGAALALALAAVSWRNASPAGRSAVAGTCVVAVACLWFSRQNAFEWKFNPLAHARYARASDAKFVDPQDVVLAVALNGEAAAYPVRQLAYHHLVQDVVGGVPLVVTY